MGKVITAAVAGNEETRRLRACIAKATCGNLENYFALEGAVNGSVPPPLEMTGSKKTVVTDTGVDVKSIEPIDKFETNCCDTVLIIGQVCFKFFNKDCLSLLSGIKNCHVHIMGGTNPMDFNIASEGVEMLKNNRCTIFPVPTSECPKYQFVEQWAPLISNYDKVAQDVHNIAVAAFLTSRTVTNDGAFYRQFGLADMAHAAETGWIPRMRRGWRSRGGRGKAIIKFESTLANKVKSSADFPEDIKYKMDAIIKHCNSNKTPYYGEGKVGGTEEVYKKLYSMWNSALNADTHSKLMEPLSALILESLQTVGSPGANEYDGYTTAKMLYLQNSKEKELTATEHYTDLTNLFNNGVCSPVWKTGLKKILEKGNLYVYHDAGLDPYVDDYIALKILSAAYKELELENHLGNPARRGGRRKSRKKTKKNKRKSKKGGKRQRKKTKKKN
jgi:hypothetical protein